MTHYLCDGEATLVDIEATPKDIQCVIVVDAYSHFLLATPTELLRQQVILDFYAISEIRGLYFESERLYTGNATFGHEEAGRIHLSCSLNPVLWKKWMQRTGRAPFPVEVEVVDAKEDSK